MKKIEVVIPPFELDEIRDALIGAGADGMCVTEVKVSDSHGHTACYRGATYPVWFAARCKVEVVVPEHRVALCLDAVRFHVDGELEMAVYSLDDSVRIRSGEHVSRAA